MSIDLLKAKNRFSAVAQDLVSPEGPIPLLIGMDNMDDTPKEQERERTSFCIDMSLAQVTWCVGT